MDLLLNNVLNLTKEEIQNSKIEFNMQAGSGGQPFLDRWLKHSEAEKMSGTCSDCSYWGWYGKQRNFYPGQWVFSFARMNDDEWLLISAAEIIDVPADEWAAANVLERFVPLFGRLIIKCKKGNTFSRYVFNLSKYLDQATVKEILPCLYSGENFEGYDRVHLPYNRLADIFNGRIMPTYYEALKKITGVYCLTDTHNGKHYIAWCCSKHISQITECSMQFIRDDDIKTAFVTMMNKLIFGQKFILRPLLDGLRNQNSAASFLRIEELETKIENNMEQSQMLTGLLAKGYLEPALFNKEKISLEAERERLLAEKDQLTRSINGNFAKVDEVDRLLKFTTKSKMLKTYEDELFENYAEKIIVYSREIVGFELKCGITLKERLVN
ncbi:zinc ribbon domain-containing protein [Clostridium perfringens]